MNKIGFLSIFILSFLFLCGCQNRHESSTKEEIISIHHKIKDKALISEFAQSIKYIPLTTSDEVLIDEIIRIINSDKNIYVADKSTLYKFSDKGLFVSKIAKKGSGAGEYNSISDFQIDKEGKAWILSRTNKALYQFSWEGELIKTIDLDCQVSNIFLIDNNIMALYLGNETENNNCRLWVINLEINEVIGTYLDIDKNKSKYLHVKSNNHFSSTAKHTYFYELFNDTIYSITTNGVIAKNYFEIEGKNIPKSFYEKPYSDIMDFFQNLFKHSYAYGAAGFLENDNKYLYSYLYEKKYYMNIYEKNSSSSYSFTTIYDDMELYDYPINLSDIDIFINKNDAMFSVSPSDIINYANEHLDKEKRSDVMRKINYTSEDQNPVIIICKF